MPPPPELAWKLLVLIELFYHLAVLSRSKSGSVLLEVCGSTEREREREKERKRNNLIVKRLKNSATFCSCMVRILVGWLARVRENKKS